MKALLILVLITATISLATAHFAGSPAAAVVSGEADVPLALQKPAPPASQLSEDWKQSPALPLYSGTEILETLETRCFEDICLSTVLVENQQIEIRGQEQLNSLKNRAQLPRYAVIASSSSTHKQCSFLTSETQKPHLDSILSRFPSLCELPRDDIIVGELLHDEYVIVFSPISGTAFYLGDSLIELSTSSPQEDVDHYILHETVHSALEGFSLPPWLDEGFAEYLSLSWIGEPIEKAQYNLPGWDPRETSPEENVLAYNAAGSVVKELADKYNPATLKTVLLKLRDSIKPQDPLFVKNNRVVLAFQEVTGDKSITLRSLTSP